MSGLSMLMTTVMNPNLTYTTKRSTLFCGLYEFYLCDGSLWMTTMPFLFDLVSSACAYMKLSKHNEGLEIPYRLCYLRPNERQVWLMRSQAHKAIGKVNHCHLLSFPMPPLRKPNPPPSLPDLP